MPYPLMYMVKSLAIGVTLLSAAAVLFLHHETAIGLVLSIAALCESLMASAILGELESRLKHAKPTSGKDA